MTLPKQTAWCLLLGLALSACKSGGPAPAKPAADSKEAPAATTPPQAAAGDEAAAEPDAPPAPKIENDMFALTLASTGGDKVGRNGALSIHLAGRGEWHVNQEYPIKFEIQAPEALGVTKATLERSDAKKFGEEEAEFESGIAPKTAGAHEGKCEASFAMCTEENCVLEKRTLALNVQVE